MCIGLPLQVVEVLAPGRARARGRGNDLLIDTRLVGDCRPGDWVLVFIDAARERLDETRALEIQSALDLLEQGLSGHHDPQAPADPGFVLPSAMNAAQLAALIGAATADPATAAAPGSIERIAP